jgi:hypothetical protein
MPAAAYNLTLKILKKTQSPHNIINAIKIILVRLLANYVYQTHTIDNRFT